MADEKKIIVNLPASLLEDLTRGNTSIEVDVQSRHVKECRDNLHKLNEKLTNLQLCKRAVNADIREVNSGIDIGESIEELTDEKKDIAKDIKKVNVQLKELHEKLATEEQKLRNASRANKYNSYSWVVENLKHLGDSLCPSEMLEDYTLPQIIAGLQSVLGEKVSYKYSKKIKKEGKERTIYVVKGLSEAFDENEDELKNISLYFQKEGVPFEDKIVTSSTLF